MKTGQLIDMLREYADNIEENYGRDKEFDWSPNTYMLSAPFLGTYDGYVNLKNPVSEDDDDEYYESNKKSNSQIKKEAKIKIPVKSFKEEISDEDMKHQKENEDTINLMEETLVSIDNSVNILKNRVYYGGSFEPNIDYLEQACNKMIKFSKELKEY